MDRFAKNIIIMIAPVIILTLPLLIGFGESFLLLAVPVFIGIALSLTLAKRLDTKDAIAYPFVQYSYIVLLFWFMWAYPNIGLGFIIQGPFIFIVNTVFVYCYFRFAKKKRMASNICILAITLLITSFLYSEHYGENRSTPVLVRMLAGDFGDTRWVKETVISDDVFINGGFGFRLERVSRSSPISFDVEMWLIIYNFATNESQRTRIDQYIDEMPRMGSRHLIDVSPIDDNGRFLVSTNSSFYIHMRWVFEVDANENYVKFKEEIHVSTIGRLSDDKFTAWLHMVNFLEGDAKVRLVMRDLDTGEAFQIAIDIDMAEVRFDDLFESWWSWGVGLVEITPTDVPKVYLVLLTDRLLVNERVFELDMNIN